MEWARTFLETLDNDQLQFAESRLFDEFTRLDQLVADQQRILQQLEVILTAVAVERRAREGDEQPLAPPLQEVDVDRSVSPPVYVDDRLAPPEDPAVPEGYSEVCRSGPFEIRHDENGQISTVSANLGNYNVVLERVSETTAAWGICEKTNVVAQLLQNITAAATAVPGPTGQP